MSANVTHIANEGWQEVWLQAQLAIEDRAHRTPAGEPAPGLASFVNNLAARMTSQLTGGASSGDQRISRGLDEPDRAHMREQTEREFETLVNRGAITIEHPGPRPWDEVITQNMGEWFGPPTRNRRSNLGNGQIHETGNGFSPPAQNGRAERLTHASGNRRRQRAIAEPYYDSSAVAPPDHSGGILVGDPREVVRTAHSLSSDEDWQLGEYLNSPSQRAGDSPARSLRREQVRRRLDEVRRRREERDQLGETQRRSRIDTPPQNERTAVPFPVVPPLPVPIPPIVHQYRGFRDATSAPMLRPGMVPNPEQLVAILRNGQRFHALDCTQTMRGAEYVTLRLALGRRYTSCMTCHAWRFILYDQVAEASVRPMPVMPVHGAWPVPAPRPVPNPQSPQRRRGRNSQRQEGRNSPAGHNNAI